MTETEIMEYLRWARIMWTSVAGGTMFVLVSTYLRMTKLKEGQETEYAAAIIIWLVALAVLILALYKMTYAFLAPKAYIIDTLGVMV